MSSAREILCDRYVGVANPQPYPYESVWDGHRDKQGHPTGIILNCAYAPSGREYQVLRR